MANRKWHQWASNEHSQCGAFSNQYKGQVVCVCARACMCDLTVKISHFYNTLKKGFRNISLKCIGFPKRNFQWPVLKITSFFVVWRTILIIKRTFFHYKRTFYWKMSIHVKGRHGPVDTNRLRSHCRA